MAQCLRAAVDGRLSRIVLLNDDQPAMHFYEEEGVQQNADHTQGQQEISYLPIREVQALFPDCHPYGRQPTAEIKAPALPKIDPLLTCFRHHGSTFFDQGFCSPIPKLEISSMRYGEAWLQTGAWASMTVSPCARDCANQGRSYSSFHEWQG